MSFWFGGCCQAAEEPAGAVIVAAQPSLPHEGQNWDATPSPSRQTSKGEAGDGGGETFIVKLVKESNGPVGLDIGLRDQDTAIIKGVPGGPVSRWNETADESTKVFEGDKILEVSGMRGNSKLLLEELQRLKGETEIILLLQRREEVSVSLHVGNGLIGLDINCNKSKEGLIVKKVNEGIVKKWNSENESIALKAGDRIIAVNGARGEPKMLLEKLRYADTIDIVFVRF